METLPRELATSIVSIPVQAIGELTGFDTAGSATVRTEFGEFPARKAASCLLEPRSGDRVLVCGPTLESAWIIAVLERREPGPARLAFDGDAELAVTGGSLNLRAERTLGLESGTLKLRAREGVALIDRCHWVGRECAALVGRLRLTGNLLETFVDRITQFAKQSLRSVEEMDQVRSGVVDYQAEKTMNLRGRELLATAEELVKVDGGQIHLG